MGRVRHNERLNRNLLATHALSAAALTLRCLLLATQFPPLSCIHEATPGNRGQVSCGWL